jgi:DNA modification methylase
MAKKNSKGPSMFDLSDPGFRMPEGYYAGDKPNPQLRQFVERHATPYFPEQDEYQIEAYRQPLTVENRRDALNDLHIYWSKKPYAAIRQYIRHFTKPGDIVFDPFCGSGGTLLAALLDGRKAIGTDRSPAACFISKNYCTPVDVSLLDRSLRSISSQVMKDIKWLYESKCDRCDGAATITYMVHSQVFQCPRCLAKVALFDCVEVGSVTASGKPKKVNVCPHCHAKGNREIIRSQSEKFGFVPVMVSYVCESGCVPSRGERLHNDSNTKKREYFGKYDLAKVKRIEASELPYWYPQGHSMKGFSRYQRDALFYYGVEEASDLFSRRSLWALGAILAAIRKLPVHAQDMMTFALSGSLWNASRMYQQREAGGGPAKGMYYVPQICREVAVWTLFTQKVANLRRSAEFWHEAHVESLVPVLLSTQSACDLAAIPSNTLDYIFTDPPYAEKVQYGELNYVWEAWLGLDTSWHDEEIIVNDVRGKTEADWAAMMKKAMAECYRILKPGRWLSLCYHDTSEGSWTLVQDIMAEVGFVVDKTESALFIDTGQKSYNQLTADKTTKRDLVLNFRKPQPGQWRVTQIFMPENADLPTFTDLGTQVIRDFLTAHPGATKDRVYDALVSSMVRKGQMETHDFDRLLRTVAEDVRQAGQQARWYLKETADQVDHAEQAKEEAAAARLEKYSREHLQKHLEREGVHYSDLFEQFLPVADKPRRLLADWLPEYFIKTPGGTWRLPDKEERQQLAKLREAGTLRRIKRFANALIDGVPVREKDRPGSDVDLLDWLRQCRRAGLYEQGRAIYEKGGLNLANLDDEQQIEAEDNYRSCVKHGSEEDVKPKRKSRKKQDDDE